MQTGTILLILLAALVALLLALYQYSYRYKYSRRLGIILAFLRFVSLFSLLLLLINPQFKKESYTTIPHNLVVLRDNSASMTETDAAVQAGELSESITSNANVAERFRVIPYRFGTGIEQADSLDFKDKATNLSYALESLNEVYARSNTTVVLLSDGNQTLGEDYEYSASGQRLPVFTMALGDTTHYEDLRIDQANSNKYAFLNNQFPVETYISYSGEQEISARLRISVDNRQVHTELFHFSPSRKSANINTLIKASEVGVKNIRISLSPLENERNTANNERTLAVEVIDEQTDVTIVSELLHPDIGALVKAIESNEQRTVQILNPGEAVNSFADTDVFILYQPGSTFKPVYDYIQNAGTSIFTITGPRTNWDFLNGVQSGFELESLGQSEEIVPVLNAGFQLFDLGDLRIENYPPLESELGDILITRQHETLLSQRIRGIDMDEPLLVILSGTGQKEALLFGEHLWKWRMQNFRNDGDFKTFDTLIGKIMLYLAGTSANQRFSVDYNRIFQGTSEALIRAYYFDETFVFDADAEITLQLKGVSNGVEQEVPMTPRGTYFEADLSKLTPGGYTFTARVNGTGFTRNGSFTILDFEVEKQLVATDYKKLGRLAEKTGGKLYFPAEATQFLDSLLTDDRFLPVQKSELIVVSLIDYRWLLALVAIALACEWFIRKYNGLI
jgi:hypothetical protein